MSPVDQSAGRHWGGRGEPTGAWACPTCGAKNAGPVGEGCGSCGAGSAAKNAEAAAEAARVAALARVEVTPEAMRAQVYSSAELFSRVEPFEYLSAATEVTIIHALEFYLAQAQPQDGDLPTPVLRAWLLELLGPDDDGKTHGDTRDVSETDELG